MQKITSSFGYISSGRYLEDVQRNLRSGVIYGDAVSVEGLQYYLNRLSDQAECLDTMKKTLFYGKDAVDRTAAIESGKARIGQRLEENGISIDLFHGLLGLITEVGEIASALSKGLEKGGSLDRVNLKEENGDCFWYQQVICKELDTTFDQSALTNTAKLKLRYPQNFTEDAAINRDLAAEREVLEGTRRSVPNSLSVSFAEPDPRDEVFTSGSDLDA